MRIYVEDNGDELDEAALVKLKDMLKNGESIAEGTAILNVHKRIHLKFGRNSGIELARSDLGGLKVELVITNAGGGYGCLIC